MDNPSAVSIVLLGDPECGKSTLFSRLSSGQDSSLTELHMPRDLDQPFIYNVRLYSRCYRFEFYDTASPENYTLLRPDFVILCYDINNRQSLINVREVWRKEVTRLYTFGNENVPIMLLGLKRDLRVEGEGIIYPEEGLRVAQEMRCERYAECSAATGELVREVFEDIARTAALTTTDKGAMSESYCIIS